MQEGVEPEKTDDPGSVEPLSVGEVEKGGKVPTARGSVRLNTFETMLDPSETIASLIQVPLCSFVVIQVSKLSQVSVKS